MVLCFRQERTFILNKIIKNSLLNFFVYCVFFGGWNNEKRRRDYLLFNFTSKPMSLEETVRKRKKKRDSRKDRQKSFNETSFVSGFVTHGNNFNGPKRKGSRETFRTFFFLLKNCKSKKSVKVKGLQMGKVSNFCIN